MKTLWIADPWKTLDHARDTTLRLVEEAARLGVSSWLCDASGLRLDRGHVRVRCRSVESVPNGRAEPGWGFGRCDDLSIAHFDMVHYRVDPPVDRRYWEPLQLLRVAEESGYGTRIVNPLAILTLVSEKLGPAQLVGHLPPTLAASAWSDLATFGAAERVTVLKPLGDAQSRSVHLLKWTSPDEVENARCLLERATGGFSHPVVLQRFLEDVLTEGEKRLWYAEGALVAYVRKRPAPGTFVVDMDRGATCEPCELTRTETRLASAIGRSLRAASVSLAAVDIIGTFVTDANVTSPGLIPAMEEVLDRNVARPVIEQLLLDHQLRAG